MLNIHLNEQQQQQENLAHVGYPFIKNQPHYETKRLRTMMSRKITVGLNYKKDLGQTIKFFLIYKWQDIGKDNARNRKTEYTSLLSKYLPKQ